MKECLLWLWLRWRKLRGLVAPPVAVAVCAGVLVCMAMAQVQLLMNAAASGQWALVDDPLVVVARAFASLAITAWIVQRCETSWLRPAKLDWRSFRREGWTSHRTAVVAISCTLAWIHLRESGFFEAVVLYAPMVELQTRVVIACGFAMWCAVAVSLLWSLASSIDGGGGGLQGAFVPLVPASPRKRQARALASV